LKRCARREARIGFRRALVGVVVEEDEVEVGGVAELLAAELAVGDHREARPLAVSRRHLRPDRAERGVEHQIRRLRKMVGEPLDGEQAREVLREQSKDERLVLLAQHVHLPLRVARGVGEQPLQRARELGPVGRRVQHAVVEQLVEQQRVPRDELGGPAGGGDHARDPLQRLRMLGEQREIRGAARDGLDQIEAARERRIGVGAARRRRGERRHERVHAPARLRRQQRIALAATRGEQAIGAHLRVSIAAARERVRHGLAVVLPQIRRVHAGRLGERVLEMPLHGFAVSLQLGVERRPVGVVRHARHALAVFGAFRQGVRLLVLEVLQPVLGAAQEPVGLAQLAHGGRGQQLALLQPRQRLERRAHGEPGVAPPAHELQRLRDELDLADATGAELHVLGELAPRHLPSHLGVQTPHRGERGVVEVLAIHERPHDGGELLVRRPAQGARLDPRVALPLAALRDEIGLERLEAGRERSGVAVGPQPHVHAKGESVLRDLGEQADEPAARALQALGVGAVGVGEDEVDVGGDVELAAAELAHGHDHQVWLAHPLERRRDLELREVAHRPADFLERGPAFEVARHDPQQYPLAQSAQPPPEVRLVLALGAGERLDHRRARERRVGAQLLGKLRTGCEQSLGIARKGDFPNHSGHLRLE